MKCPICKAEVALEHPDMPFCGSQCRNMDLGNWATEKYTISSPLEDIDEDEVVVRNELDED